MAMTMLSNNPVVLMLLPDKIYVQEIKLVNNQGGPSKAKIQDMVATRHFSAASSTTKSSFVSSSSNSLSIQAIVVSIFGITTNSRAFTLLFVTLITLSIVIN